MMVDIEIFTSIPSHHMQPNFVRKLKYLAFICLFTSFAGVIYQLINEERLDHNSVLVGFPLGLVFGLMELFLFPKAESKFRNWSFTGILFFKTILYTAAIYAVTLSLVIVAGLFEGRKLSELPAFLNSTHQVVLVFYTLSVYSLLVFLLQINHLLGEGVLWKFIRGKYHKPREEERIFMFLDMKSSTTIAEQLGHVRFYALLNELFHEISQPVLQTKAEIYQYVGDEVVLTWEVNHGLEGSNCLKAFFLFQENLHRKSESYLHEFGVKPEFKAGLHYGKVISAQIGDLKREIVYNGDVLNTTSRIQNECNKYQRNCLVSGSLIARLPQLNSYRSERIDAVTLRGKETEVELYSVVSNHQA
ncbi:adenylate/guanylate cyclase domain-containing protein [Rufibacter latericius]|uniref:Adenylate/guanylate cyclase domain-containing protein n=1 Tax=Rufibacter latericius TaxID=2487040 RepID=A0A3M9MJY2_9BACT|nr:adenylate/guanylate cyclase domain-containing protein [Rufibacter latericius]RNI24968.1 adenylate/guanylate cyclase domain-containing protein [Rufibacter latericius]